MIGSKFILGTAQFGLDYGINNYSGSPSEIELHDLFDTAYENGINCLDTAEAYGNAIDRIGRYHRGHTHRFQIMSKFKFIQGESISEKVRSSLDKLSINNFEVYSFHSFKDYSIYPHLMDELIKIKNSGLIKKIGISVYTNTGLENILYDENIDVVQLPYNMLDNINIRGNLLSSAKKYGKEVHVRSVFLQGLFFMDEPKMPEKLKPLNVYLNRINEFCAKESISIQTLALSYVAFNSDIDKVLIGVDTKAQLLSNIVSLKNVPTAFDYINKNILVNETELLNPVNWK